jgi:iron complex transport system ATP-binding protein
MKSRPQGGDSLDRSLTLCLDKAQARVGMIGATSLSLSGPKVIGVIGANGSGKSSLLRLMSGLNCSQKRGVYLAGTSLFELSPLERSRRIAYLPQSPPVSSAWSVEELLRQGLHPHRGSERLSTQEGMLEDLSLTLELTSLRSRSVTSLSGGELRRSLIARALIQGASVTLLDEPLAGLDWPSQELLMALLRQRSQQDHGLLVVALHCLNLAALYTDELIILSRGEVIGHEESGVILHSPLIKEAFQDDPFSIKHPRHGVFQRLPQGMG